MAPRRTVAKPQVKLEISIDGRAVSLDSPRNGSVHEVAPGVYSVLYGGRSYEVRIVNSGGQWRATVGDRSFTLDIQDPRDSAKRQGATVGHLHQDVKAPMAGKVIRLLVREGDEVNAGQGIAVVEAMKMQNELKALRAGRVIRVAVKDGDTVGAGDALVTIE
jgi:acetyl/propionyl-CoA carboxylase alpha subunit